MIVGQWNVNSGRYNVIMGPWNVNRGTWNAIMGQCNLLWDGGM